MEKKKFYNQSLLEFFDTLKTMSEDSGLNVAFTTALDRALNSDRIPKSTLDMVKALHDGDYTNPISVTLEAEMANGQKLTKNEIVSFRLYENRDGKLSVSTLSVDPTLSVEQCDKARYLSSEVVESLKTYGYAGNVERKFKGGDTVVRDLMWDPVLHNIFEMNVDFRERFAERGKVFGVDLNETQKAAICNNTPFKIPKLRGHENDYFMWCPKLGNVMIVTNENILAALKNNEQLDLNMKGVEVKEKVEVKAKRTSVPKKAPTETQSTTVTRRTGRSR
ncbi:MAG: hypothetical protein K6E35_07435 [Bacteroidales bacterium]|nr:hypothetical protein [Bacteroidales bacterium]